MKAEKQSSDKPAATLKISTKGGVHKPDKGDKVKKHKELCWRFYAKNKCAWGDNCHFQHKCVICRKTGHGAIACSRCKFSEKEVKKEG